MGVGMCDRDMARAGSACVSVGECGGDSTPLHLTPGEGSLRGCPAGCCPQILAAGPDQVAVERLSPSGNSGGLHGDPGPGTSAGRYTFISKSGGFAPEEDASQSGQARSPETAASHLACLCQSNMLMGEEWPCFPSVTEMFGH